MHFKEITLYFEDIPLSTLSEVNNKYLHNVNTINVKKALERGCSETILASKSGIWEDIPPIFYELEITPSRTDIYDILGIKETDSRFDKLYKKALKSELFNKDNYWISVK
jgi:hypothetical protein